MTQLGELLTRTSQAPPQAVKLFTAREVAREGGTGFYSQGKNGHPF